MSHNPETSMTWSSTQRLQCIMEIFLVCQPKSREVLAENSSLMAQNCYLWMQVIKYN